MMSFDECPQFYQPYDYVKKSIERTSRWAERGLKAHRRPHDQGLFGREEHLRAVEVIFKGYPFFGDVAGIRQ